MKPRSGEPSAIVAIGEAMVEFNAVAPLPSDADVCSLLGGAA